MKIFYATLAGVLLIAGPALAKTFPDLEAGKGDLAINNICSGTTGDAIQRVNHANGSLHIKAYCKDGKFNGIVKKYYDNGKIQMKAEYTAGVLNGTVKIHDETGTIIYRDEYENGTRKAHMYYDDKGDLVSVP